MIVLSYVVTPPPYHIYNILSCHLVPPPPPVEAVIIIIKNFNFAKHWRHFIVQCGAKVRSGLKKVSRIFLYSRWYSNTKSEIYMSAQATTTRTRNFSLSLFSNVKNYAFGQKVLDIQYVLTQPNTLFLLIVPIKSVWGIQNLLSISA